MALRSIVRAVVLAIVLATGVSSARNAQAEESAAPRPALVQARAAWDKGSLKTAEPLYRTAIAKGGLAPEEVVEGYVRLGSIRASLGKKEQAIAAFRAASILDATFAVPAQAGRKGQAYAARAKKDTAKIGSIQLAITNAPKEVPSGKAFTVTATLDSAHVPIVAKIALVARDGTSGKEALAESAPGESVELEVASELTMPSASILVRVDALDKNGNRLASAEERVRVPENTTAVAVSRAAPLPSFASLAPASTSPPGGDTSARKGGGFWSSPWPYVIGIVAIAGAGTATYFGTRPPDEVSVGQVGVGMR